ncbi:MAG: flagellar hook protein FlgE [Mariprofundaceae bacterium]|nr:flagellar hook protein FlgE [Mariprofundaceae bacterium]
MGVFNALFAGASGLTAFGEAVRVVGDNIANVNSLGFKSQNVNFSDVLAQTVNVTRSNIANQVGNGVRIGAITRDQQQGSVKNTTNPTDMAINGNGLFAMRDPGSNQVSYTRAGAFILDKNFNLIDGQGNIVQGFKVDSTSGKATGNVTDITFGNLAANAKATTIITAGVTLDSNAPIIIGSVSSQKGNFDPSTLATFNFKSDVNVFDPLGGQHTVSIYYVKTASNAWNWYAGVDGTNITAGTADTFGVTTNAIGAAGTAGTKTFLGTMGTLSYTPTGALNVETVVATAAGGTAIAPKATNFTWDGGANNIIGFDFGNAVLADSQGPQTVGVGATGTGLNGTVQVAGSFATRQMTRDGFAAGFLDKLETDSAGKIFGVFTNGQRRALFQVALANFPNDAVLNHIGNNLLEETIASGSPVLGLPASGGLGTITPFGLEQSNVDLANEFVKLIVIQRAYEANSKTILTTDQMLQSLMQIKR